MLVFALAIALWRLTHDTPTSPVGVAASSPAAPASPSSPPAEPASAPPRPEARPAPRVATVAPRPPELPAAAPSMASPSQDLKRDANGKLVPIITMVELRAQVAQLDAAMKACIERGGPRATGKATLSFIVAARAGHLEIETTGVQDDETLVDYPDMLTCMHQTARLLVVHDHPVPALGTPIYVRRHVRVENGELAENSMFDFSYSH